MYNNFKISFKALPENIIFSRNIVQAFLIELNPTIAFLNEIKTIVSESVTNSIIHGYQLDSSKDVNLEIMYDEHDITITVTDEGIGIEDIEKAKEALFTTNVSDDRCGLGLTIIDVYCDNFTIESSVNKGTKIVMHKKINNCLSLVA